VSPAEIFTDAFSRIRDLVASTLDGASLETLTWRADAEANTVTWLVWHLTRVQDDHVAGAAGGTQVWTDEGWEERFGLPFETGEIGYGQDPADVALVSAGADLLRGYHDAVCRRTLAFVAGIDAGDLERVVDEAWDPPVTLGVRLVSVVADDLQHVGQAAFVRGLAERA
jgi:hypothetical protein